MTMAEMVDAAAYRAVRTVMRDVLGRVLGASTPSGLA